MINLESKNLLFKISFVKRWAGSWIYQNRITIKLITAKQLDDFVEDYEVAAEIFSIDVNISSKSDNRLKYHVDIKSTQTSSAYTEKTADIMVYPSHFLTPTINKI